jgi:hypothetical protein
MSKGVKIKTKMMGPATVVGTHIHSFLPYPVFMTSFLSRQFGLGSPVLKTEIRDVQSSDF